MTRTEKRIGSRLDLTTRLEQKESVSDKKPALVGELKGWVVPLAITLLLLEIGAIVCGEVAVAIGVGVVGMFLSLGATADPAERYWVKW